MLDINKKTLMQEEANMSMSEVSASQNINNTLGLNVCFQLGLHNYSSSMIFTNFNKI